MECATSRLTSGRCSPVRDTLDAGGTASLPALDTQTLSYMNHFMNCLQIWHKYLLVNY